MLEFQICLTGRPWSKRGDDPAGRCWVFRPSTQNPEHSSNSMFFNGWTWLHTILIIVWWISTLLAIFSGDSKKRLIKAVPSNKENIEIGIRSLLPSHFSLSSIWGFCPGTAMPFSHRGLPWLPGSRKRRKSSPPVLTCLVVSIQLVPRKAQISAFSSGLVLFCYFFSLFLFPYCVLDLTNIENASRSLPRIPGISAPKRWALPRGLNPRTYLALGSQCTSGNTEHSACRGLSPLIITIADVAKAELAEAKWHILDHRACIRWRSDSFEGRRNLSAWQACYQSEGWV